MQFTSFDYLIMALVGVTAVSGLARGFTREAINLAAWVAAVFAVRLFHEQLTPVAAQWAGGPGRGATLAFVLLFAGTLIAGKLLAMLVGGAARNSIVGPIDRVLGLGLGAFKGLIAASAIFLVADFATNLFDPDKNRPAWLADSRVTPILDVTSRALVTWVERAQSQDPPPFTGEGDHAKHGGGGDPPPPGEAAARRADGGGSGEPQTRDDAGYATEDRAALNDLLKDQPR